MKIAILSLTRVHNYGGSLQAYALEYVIKKEFPNIKCEYLDYQKGRIKSCLIWLIRKGIFKFLHKNDNPSWTIKEFINIVFLQNRIYGNKTETEQLFNEFWNECNFSKKYSRRGLKEISDQYDLFLVGSDQTWNCGGLTLDKTYLLDFVKDAYKKVNYATSFGFSEFPPKYIESYRKYLSQFSKLSCRENKGVELIENIVEKEATLVLDPTLLMSKDDWSRIADLNVCDETPFILVYVLGNSLSLLHYAKQLSKKLNIRCVYIYGSFSENKNVIGPKQWLGYMLKAKVVVTNSFHGVAFSINFNKNFYVEITNKEFFLQSADRIYTILEMFNLNERVISNSDNIIESIDYRTVNLILEKERKKSREFLRSIIC